MPFYSKDGFACSCNKNECDECNKKYVAPSNADRIRAMSDEELAEKLSSPQCIRPNSNDCNGANDCFACILEWLKKEVEDG